MWFPFLGRAGRHKPASSSKRPRHRAILRLERLETRDLPSATSISGYVFGDLNSNGLKDAAESGIGNVSVQLVNSSGAVVGTAVTSPSGYYQFTQDNSISSTPLTQEQDVTLPNQSTNWAQTADVHQFDPSQGTLVSVDIIVTDTMNNDVKLQNLDPLGAKINFTVNGTTTLSLPGVNQQALSMAYSDGFTAAPFSGTFANFNGKDGIDFGPHSTSATATYSVTSAADLANYIGTGKVNLSASASASATTTGAGNLLAQFNTSGSTKVQVIYHYIPNNALQPGNYTIVEMTEPPGFVDGLLSTGGKVIPNSIGITQINVTLGQTSLTDNDFAKLKPSSVAGFVYVDGNNDGVKQAGEQAVANVSVHLKGTDDTGASVDLTATTNNSGAYNFSNLRPGNYSITDDQPAGYIAGKNTIGTPGGTPASGGFANIALAQGVNGANNNFGELVASSLAGFVYVDTNNNGQKEPGENGLGGVVVTLTGTNDQGSPVSLTATTANDGSYAFNNLRPGSYTLTEKAPAGYQAGQDTAGSQGATTVGNRSIAGINLAMGVNGVNNNFAELASGSISGFVYQDVNNNGSRDAAEQGVAGVTITLTGTDSAGNAINLTTQTAANGSYQFTGLLAGTYQIAETLPTGYLDGKNLSMGTKGGTFDPVLDQYSQLRLTNGASAANYNFGVVKQASVQGIVYFDANSNGIIDNGELGLPDVQVILTGTNSMGQPITQSVTTDPDGNYQFDGLYPGTYTVTATTPTGFTAGKLNLGNVPRSSIRNNSFVIPLSFGTVGTDFDFAELLQQPTPPHIDPPPPPNFSKWFMFT